MVERELCLMPADLTDLTDLCSAQVGQHSDHFRQSGRWSTWRRSFEIFVSESSANKFGEVGTKNPND